MEKEKGQALCGNSSRNAGLCCRFGAEPPLSKTSNFLPEIA